MTEKFSLMNEYKNLQEAKNNPQISEKKEDLTNKIKYQEYIIEVDKKECSVYIPLRECENFEAILEHTSDIKRIELKKLLREFRGIINIG